MESFAADASGQLAIGPWERAMLNAHAADDAFCVNWTVALDRPLDPGMVLDALTALRPAFPRYFARAERTDTTWRLRRDHAVAAVVRHHGRNEGGARGVAGRLARTRLDPERDGLFRCHVIEGPEPVLAFQTTHVVGDGYTNHMMRSAFAAALGTLAGGGRPAALPPALALPPPGPDDVAATLAPDPRAFAFELRRMLRLRPAQLPAAAGPFDVRVFRAVLPAEAFAPVMRRAARLAVTPLSLLLAALAGAMRDAMPPLEAEPGEFLLPQVPRDFRAALSRPSATGNLVFAQGIPVLADDPSELDALAVTLHDRQRRGQSNRLMYRHFLHELKVADTQPPVRPQALHLFPVFGVTEIPNRSPVTRLGHARVCETVFQTPILTRRFTDGRVHLGCALRCTATAEAALRRLLADLLLRLFGTIPAWDLL